MRDRTAVGVMYAPKKGIHHPHSSAIAHIVRLRASAGGGRHPPGGMRLGRGGGRYAKLSMLNFKKMPTKFYTFIYEASHFEALKYAKISVLFTCDFPF